ncbi:MAG: hypothetical protein WAQ52_08300, partial [Terriglobales bacterium]
MTRYLLTLALTAWLALGAMSAPAQLQEKPADKPAAAPSEEGPFAKFQHFSAILNGGMGRDTNRQIYRSGKLMRFDFANHHRIVDLETRTLVLVYPDKCSKVPMMDPGVFPFSRKFRVESSTPAGKETVDSHACKVEDMVLVSEGPMNPMYKMKLYEAEDLNGFPLKIDVENPATHAKFTINYSGVSLEPPDAKLFE